MSNLLGFCPLKRENCPYSDSYCFDCVNTKKTSVQAQVRAKRVENQEKGLGKILREDLKTE